MKKLTLKKVFEYLSISNKEEFCRIVETWNLQIKDLKFDWESTSKILSHYDLYRFKNNNYIVTYTNEGHILYIEVEENNKRKKYFVDSFTIENKSNKKHGISKEAMIDNECFFNTGKINKIFKTSFYWKAKLLK